MVRYREEMLGFIKTYCVHQETKKKKEKRKEEYFHVKYNKIK